MNCSGIMPGGKAADACILDQPTNLIITKSDVSFSNYVNAHNSEKWREPIQETLKMYVTLPMRSVAVEKASEVKETDGAGVNVTTNLVPGGAVVDLKTSACDFKEILQSMEGGFYKVIIGMGAQKAMVYEKKDGTLQGFTAQLTAIPIGFPSKDAKFAEFQLSINWSEIEEFKRFRIIELPLMLNELTEYTPLGLDAKVKTALSGDDMTLTVNERCVDTLITETLTAKIESFSPGMDTPAVTVTAVSGTDGDYTVKLEKGATPAQLEAGDYINYRLVKKTGDIYDSISNIIYGRLWT